MVYTGPAIWVLHWANVELWPYRDPARCLLEGKFLLLFREWSFPVWGFENDEKHILNNINPVYNGILMIINDNGIFPVNVSKTLTPRSWIFILKTVRWSIRPTDVGYTYVYLRIIYNIYIYYIVIHIINLLVCINLCISISPIFPLWFFKDVLPSYMFCSTISPWPWLSSSGALPPRPTVGRSLGKSDRWILMNPL